MSNIDNDLDDGLQEGNGGGSGRFLSIRNGRFIERVPEGTEGATPRTLKMGVNAGSTVYEKFYSVLTGSIEGMYVKEPRVVNFGDGDREMQESVIVMRIADGVVQVDLGNAGQAFSSFAKALPNIDINRKVRLSPYDYIGKKDGERKIGMGITQAPTAAQKADSSTKYENDGTVKVTWYWDRNNQRELPEPVKFFNPKTKKDELVWDDHDEYLRNYIRQYGEKLKEAKESELAQQEQQEQPPKSQPAEVSDGANAATSDIDDQDLPF
jgi:hypothetical protein